MLHRALKTLVHITPKRSTFPTLESILIEPADGGLAITATDLTTEARIVVPASDAFPTCLPARPLLEFVASLERDTEVTLSLHGDTVRVAAAGATIDLPQRPTIEFPKKLAHTGAAITASAIALVLRGLKGQPIEISVGKATARFSSPSWAITTRLIDAHYPAYAQVIPMASGSAFVMKVGAVDLTAGLKRIGGRSSRRSDKTMRLSANGAIKLDTIGDDVQRAVTVGVIETTHTGDDHVQGFIARYLLDAIADLDAVASLRFFKAEDPLVIESDTRTAVIMPWRL